VTGIKTLYSHGPAGDVYLAAASSLWPFCFYHAWYEASVTALRAEAEAAARLSGERRYERLGSDESAVPAELAGRELLPARHKKVLTWREPNERSNGRRRRP